MSPVQTLSYDEPSTAVQTPSVGDETSVKMELLSPHKRSLLPHLIRFQLLCHTQETLINSQYPLIDPIYIT